MAMSKAAKVVRQTTDELGITNPKNMQKAGNDGLAGTTSSNARSDEATYKLIQERAYFKAKARDFAPGHEVEDWISAEAEVRGASRSN